MNQPNFQILEMRASSPKDWLCSWEARYDEQNDDDQEYQELIQRHMSF